MTPAQREIMISKPLNAMRAWASLLNWHGLQLEWIRFSQRQIATWDVPSTGIIFYYVTPDEKFNLQINELATATSTHRATVQAYRYGIRDVGWHPLTLFADAERLQAEARRLQPWLDRHLYKNRSWVRDFRNNHPELLLPSRKRRRGGKWMRQIDQRLAAANNSPLS